MVMKRRMLITFKYKSFVDRLKILLCLLAVGADLPLGVSIPNDSFMMANKLICAEVPELADVQPPNCPKGVKFEYWVNTMSFPSYLKWTLWYITSSTTE